MKICRGILVVVYVCLAAIPAASLAQELTTVVQERYRSGFDPYVYITHSSDISIPLQVVTEIHANVPFYIGIQLPPLLARHKDFSTDYAVDLTVFRPDGKEFLKKDKYYSSKDKIFEKSVFRFVRPMMMLSFDQNQTKGTYRIHIVLQDFIAGTKTNSSCTVELK